MYFRTQLQMCFRTQLLQREGKKRMEVVEIVKVNQSRGITDTYANNTKHRSTHTMSLKNVDLWKELSNEEMAYWLERGSSEV